jgi:thiol-disulfide isomerase/thioredoxin
MVSEEPVGWCAVKVNSSLHDRPERDSLSQAAAACNHHEQTLAATPNQLSRKIPRMLSLARHSGGRNNRWLVRLDSNDLRGMVLVRMNKSLRYQWSVGATAIAFFLSGCESSPPPKPVANGSAQIEAATSTTPAAAATTPHEATSGTDGVTKSVSDSAAVNDAAVASNDVELREMDWDQVQKLVAEHTGKVVVVDIWSTACTPCLREFPSLVALKQKYPDDVVCVSFDCDYAGIKKKPVAYYRERVLNSLTELKADQLINGMSTIAADELFLQLDLDSIPAVYVYDRAGKLAKRFDNRTPAGKDEEGISYETQINPLVADLVKAARE